MLSFLSRRRHGTCEGVTRRDMLRVGALGLGGLSLADLLLARASAARSGVPTKDTSVIWLWLSGGASQIETFDPKMTAPSDYRSMTDELPTVLPGITFGGGFPKLASVADRLAVVRSFSHTNNDHAGGTHYVMTAYDNKSIGSGAPPTRPGIGSVVSRACGPNHPVTGMPTYVKLGNIRADRYDVDGPLFLGSAYAPFSPSGDAGRDMSLQFEQDRVDSRRKLVTGLDRLRRGLDEAGQVEAMLEYQSQAFDVILGSASEAFDLEKEDKKTRDKFNNGLGRDLLRARRLCEAGCGFVTVVYGGWDHHEFMEPALKRLSPELDQAASTFVEHLYERGLDEKILLVVTGEFGRTPRVNNKAGRDHWAPLSTLAFSGGGTRVGQAIGQSAAKADVPKSTPITPQDLMSTIFHVLGIDQHLQYPDHMGRPLYMVENGQPIAELF